VAADAGGTEAARLQTVTKNDRRKGTRWTKVEDARITAEVRPTDRKLSKALGRSVQAIQQRRSSVLHGHTSA
jgi:hypothetical protein